MRTAHDAQVKVISQQLKQCYKQKKKVRVYHGTTNSTRTQTFHKDGIIDISSLNNVLEVNTKEKYAIVEPNVPMDALVAATLKYGLVPPVVMEFPGITVGGGIQGGAGESGSFKWGAFHHTCLEYEIVLGNGKVITANAKKNADLFWGTAGSYGSLGVITKIKIRLLPAKKYVLLTYRRVNSFQESIQELETAVKHNVDFIDGILFSKDSGTIMTGVFSDKTDLSVVTFHKAYDEWFYLHAEKITSSYETWQELIPLEDYFFRYNRGAFWVGNYAFRKMRLPFTRTTRFFMNPLMKTRTLYRFLHAINISQRQIVQDLCLPKDTTLAFLKYVDKHIGIYPLWLLPGKLGSRRDKLSPGYLTSDFVIDVGVWGKIQGDYRQLIKLNRDIEKMLQKLNGRKVLYAHQYYTKEEFWKVYDWKWYKKMREKYFAMEVFPDIYEKTHVGERYAYSLTKGLLNVLKSPFKLPVS